jgi:hypothetical protein
MAGKNTIIKLISTVEGLTLVPECLPKPAKNMMPEWWKQTAYEEAHASLDNVFAGNFKACPSFVDYLTNGFMIPMWTDAIIKYDSDIDKYMWRTSSGTFAIDAHNNSQYLNSVDHLFLGKKSYFVFKFPAPWKMITPKGYSTLQLPAFYHFNEDFSAIPGVRDSDIYHNLNIQIALHTDKKEIFIPRGTPLAHFVPFKRETETLEIVDYKDILEEDKLTFKKQELELSTKFPGSKIYKHEKKMNN